MEHPLRTYARTKLAESLGGDGPSVRNAEKSIYNWAVKTTRERGDVASWENKTFRWHYRHKIMHLASEFTRGESPQVDLVVQDDHVNVAIRVIPQLVWRMRHKELETRKLAEYPAEVLWPDGPHARAMMKHREKELAIEKAKAAEKDYEGLFKCGKCKSTKTTYYQMQTRSADEPMVRSLLILLFFLLQKD